MALNNSQYDTIIRAYEQKQLHNRNVLDKRYKTVYNRLPELKDILLAANLQIHSRTIFAIYFFMVIPASEKLFYPTVSQKN